MGGEAQVTVMVLKVDLGCVKCCRKIKKVLCSIPQIRNQLFDDKSNTVTVSALCCTPEKVVARIRKKAGGTLKGIDIKQPSAQPQPPQKPAAGPPPSTVDKPKQPQQQQPPPPAAQKPQPQAAPPQATDKPKSAPPPDDKPKTAAAPPPSEKPKTDEKPKSAPPPADQKPKSDEKLKAAAPPPTASGDEKPKKVDISSPPQPQQQQVPVMMKPNQPAAFMSPELIPVAGYPSIFPPPHMMYYDHHHGGPPYNNYHNQQPIMYAPHPQPIYQYDGYQGRPVGDGYYGGGTHFSEDNPSNCTVM